MQLYRKGTVQNHFITMVYRPCPGFLYKDGLELYGFQRGFCCRGDLCKICHHTGRLLDRIILPEGDKIIVLSAQQPANVFRSAGKSVVGGNGDQHRASVTQVALGSHSHRAVGNAVGELRQSASM